MSDYFLPKPEIVAIGDYASLTQTRNWGMVDLDVPDAWKTTKGEGIVVATLDTGLCRHPDLIDNVLIDKCRSFIDGEDIYDDYQGHNCLVMGIIGAQDNEFGVVGCAPKCKIISVKVLDKNGFSRTNSIAKGLQYCIDIKPDVVNISIGGTLPDNVVHDKIKILINMGIPVVVSAGNTGKEGLLYPAKFPETFAVGSYSPTTLFSRSLFSSYGEGLTFTAPGENILSTYLKNEYAVMSGTSFSAPQVTAIIALLLSKYKKENKKISVEEIRKLLIEHCIDKGEKGWDKEFGYGKINVPSLINDQETISIPSKTKISFWQKIKSWFK